MMPKYVWLLVIVAVILISILLSGPVDTKKSIRIADITFDLPPEFKLEEKPDGRITINLRSDIENIINFNGSVQLFRDFSEYQTLTTNIKTDRGDDIWVIGSGDAGGLSVRYLIKLNDLQNNRSVLVEMKKWTYEDPSIWGTREKERTAQQKELERLFETMVRTVRFVK